jgi:hypothetical protein
MTSSVPEFYSKLKSPEECQTLMKRYKDSDKNLYKAAFKRYLEIVINEYENESDPLVKDFYKTVPAYEHLLTEKNGRTTRANRTLQKVRNKGVHQSLIDWMQAKEVKDGFKLLIENNLEQYTAEYLVMKYKDRFPQEIVETAASRLKEVGVNTDVIS